MDNDFDFTQALDAQWVIYHGNAWKELVSQGYYTRVTTERHGVTWAHMIYDGRKR